MEENINNSNNNNNNNKKGEKHVSNHSTIIIKEDLDHHQESPRKVFGGERVKRDEWSEGAVSSLLEAYESKWVLRNRAKLKGHDWEDVAKHVSARGNSTKSPKTQTQCKNKIESMKKRYRSESASAATTTDAASSSWPLYSRLHLLLRGTGPVSPVPPPTTITAITVQSPSLHAATITTATAATTNNQAFMLLEPPSVAVSQAHLQQPPTSFVAPPPPPIAQNSYGSNGVERLLAKEDGLGGKSYEHVSNKNPMDSDSSTPALYSEKDKVRCNKRKMKSSESKKRKRRNSSNNNNNTNNNNSNEEMEIVDSIRWLGEVVVRSEQTRMETMKEIEKMRVEAEAKRAEIELKRTEIIANTQLEIARIFSSINKDVDSSFRIGRS